MWSWILLEMLVVLEEVDGVETTVTMETCAIIIIISKYCQSPAS
jgi:hypothetical protein